MTALPTFDEMSPAERLDFIEHLHERWRRNWSALLERLSPECLGTCRRVALALVDDDVDDETFGAVDVLLLEALDRLSSDDEAEAAHVYMVTVADTLAKMPGHVRTCHDFAREHVRRN